MFVFEARCSSVQSASPAESENEHENECRLLGLRLDGDRLLLFEEVRRLAGEPVEQVPRFHEAAGVRLGAEDDDRHLLSALRQAQQRRQTVARLG